MFAVVDRVRWRRVLDDHEGDAAVEGEGGGEVAQVVDGDAGDAGFVAQPMEAVEDLLRVDWAAVVVEDVAVGGEGVAEEVVVGEVVEGSAGALVDGDPAEAAGGLGWGEDGVVVVDGGEGVADEQHAFVEVDVVPVQAEGLALAHAGVDDELDEVREQRVMFVCVVEEAHRLVGGPDPAFGRGRPGDDGGLGGVVAQAVAQDGRAEGAGEGGQDAVDGDLAAAGGQFGAGVLADVFVGQVVEGDVAKGGDEVVVDIGAVAGEGGGLSRSSWAASQASR